MTLYEIVTVVGLFAGPVSAVGITLWYQARKERIDRQIFVLRTLISTRHMPANPTYSEAINLIPLEFHGNRSIIKSWESYMEVVHTRPSEENRERHNQNMTISQTKLIHEISKELNYDLSESDIQFRHYTSQGYGDRDDLTIQAQVAWVRIAAALEAQNQAAGLPEPPDPKELVPEKDQPKLSNDPDENAK